MIRKTLLETAIVSAVLTFAGCVAAPSPEEPVAAAPASRASAAPAAPGAMAVTAPRPGSVDQRPARCKPADASGRPSEERQAQAEVGLERSVPGDGAGVRPYTASGCR